MAGLLDAEVVEFFRSLNRRMMNLSPVMDDIAGVLATSVQRNFQEGGRFGTENEWGGGPSHWPISQRAVLQGGMTLLDTGLLAASINVHVERSAVVFDTNKVYAAIHQYGGSAGRNHSVTLPPRPFLVVQNEDIQDIQSIVIEHYSHLL